MCSLNDFMATPRNQLLTVTTLRRELHAALKAYHETAGRDLNDRFGHYEKRSLNALSDHEKREEERHKEIMGELTNLATLIDRNDEFDYLTRYLAERFKVPVEELTGIGFRTTNR